MRSVCTVTYADSTGSARSVTEVMTPVSPMPPTVAQKRAASVSGPMVCSPPSAVTRSSETTWAPKVPSRWWFLPWMSAATAPPTVT